MAKTCSTCAHSCYVDKPCSDESVLACVNGNSYYAFTQIKDTHKKCWESVRDVNETEID